MKLLWSGHVGLGALLLLGPSSVQAIDLDLSSTDSIKQAASTIAYGMVSYYTGNRTGDVPGNLPDPYYWWEAGAMFGALVDYWYYTGDDTYNDITTQALLFQTGPDNDYMPTNQTRTLGNDDQAFWGMAALSAAEVKYPNPPEDQPQWLALAQAVFNTQAVRWDNQTCGGGLKWQIFPFNNGYNYKNTISNGCFFNIAARLGRYTGNDTYLEWAETMWDWVSAIGLMNDEYHFYDGTDDTINCTEINHIQWSYNAGVYLLGAATMWNVTESDVWRERTQGILDGTSVFFSPDSPNVMYEVACEPNDKCNVDQRSFKAYLSRWMAATTKVAPWTADYIMPKLQTSARAAAQQCSGGDDGQQCGLRWTNGANWDGSFGVGEQMSALEVIQSNLISKVSGPVTNDTGGTSQGDPAAGSNSQDTPVVLNQITTGDKVGAGFLTTFILIGILGGAWWMVA
ncbi:glycoside hydrolase [Lineolata rhizophorae]|uniref:Mannan endo-1,6-alpha-mannosidase n=1 Tax=Lineolata rhizophorae TaxID=578093 RepID=A0A6A6NSV8_9PEZI|nr:glycoside hydrolase [Lineolata rhizophorae]